jgi:serine/threonine-protein kinase
MTSRETAPTEETERVRLARQRLGHVLRDRWRLDELVQVDSWAAVYVATHRIGKRVAIKMLHPDLSRDAEAKQRFIEDGNAATRVRHSGVAAILDDDVAEDGAVFVVSELFEGETLDARVAQEGTIAPLELLTLTNGLLDVLVAAHAKGLSHGNIQPSNVLVTNAGAVKLLDFVSRPGDKLDDHVDLEAVGATMFWALTGRPVKADETGEDVRSFVVTRSQSLRGVALHLRQRLAKLIERALGIDPDDRWSDAADMQAAVRELRGLLIEQQRGAGAASSISRSRAHTRMAFAFGIGALVASVVWAGGRRPLDGARSAQPVLVAPAQPDEGIVPQTRCAHAMDSELSRNAGKVEDVEAPLPASTEKKDTVDAAYDPRPRAGVLRTRRKAVARPPVAEVPISLASMAPVVEPEPTRSALLSDPLDRRK